MKTKKYQNMIQEYSNFWPRVGLRRIKYTNLNKISSVVFVYKETKVYD